MPGAERGVDVERIVLAYSGGPGSSAATRGLAEKYEAEIITVTLDLGQRQDLEDVRDRALASGATRAHVLDAREEFARDYVLPSLKAGALNAQGMSGDRFPMTTALSRPLIARKLVEIASIEHAAAVAHAEADPSRLDVALRALGTHLEVIAASPGRRLSTVSDRTCRIESNLWGRTIGPGEPGTAANPDRTVSEDTYLLTKAPHDCPAEPASVEIAFERGVPSAINGISMPFVELIGNLAIIAGAHGVGRGPGCEAPAAAVLHAAHAELQNHVTTADTRRFTRTVGLQYGEIVHNGQWFTPLREALDAFVESVQSRVTGVVRLKLFKGEISLVGLVCQAGQVGQDEAHGTHPACLSPREA